MHARCIFLYSLQLFFIFSEKYESNACISNIIVGLSCKELIMSLWLWTVTKYEHYCVIHVKISMTIQHLMISQAHRVRLSEWSARNLLSHLVWERIVHACSSDDGLPLHRHTRHMQKQYAVKSTNRRQEEKRKQWYSLCLLQTKKKQKVRSRIKKIIGLIPESESENRKMEQ